MNPLVSIIIAMKNNKEYILDMLNSIEEQTYDNIEIIIAYDTKSTDDGLFIIENFQSKFPLTILKGNDSSIGCARNRGLSQAKGEFVWFCDADDELLPTSCADLIEPFLKHENLDVSFGSWYRSLRSEKIRDLSLKQKVISKNKKENEISILDSLDVLHIMWLKRVIPIACWGYMFRRSYINSLSIKFPDYSHGEDQIFVLQCMINTCKVARISRCVYFYKVHENSISSVRTSPDEFWTQHEEYRRDYFALVGNKYPSLEAIAYGDYMRWFTFELTALKKEEYYMYLKKYEIKALPCINKGNIIYAGACFLFNVSPTLYRICGRLMKKLRGEPTW